MVQLQSCLRRVDGAGSLIVEGVIITGVITAALILRYTNGAILVLCILVVAKVVYVALLLDSPVRLYNPSQALVGEELMIIILVVVMALLAPMIYLHFHDSCSHYSVR